MLLTDLRELKSQLEIDPNDYSEDKKLNFLVEQATNLIEEMLDRKFAYRGTTEYYCGTGTQKLCLRRRPVIPFPANPNYPTLAVTVDQSGYWGAVSGSFQPPANPPLSYGSDYALRIDQDDGSSRSAILYRLNSYWPKPGVRQAGLLSPFLGPDTGSVKVTYTAGYTVDTLPATFRWATDTLVAAMRYLLPLGVALASESYEERSISIMGEKKDFLMGLVRGPLLNFKNWTF